MERWPRWSLRKAAVWGLGLQGASLLIGSLMHLRTPTLDDAVFWIVALALGATTFVTIAALRNWVFRKSIEPDAEPPGR